MKKTILLLVLVVAGLAYFGRRPREVPVALDVPSPPSSEVAVLASPSPMPSPTAIVTRTAPVKGVIESAPSLTQLRAEVGANPHQPPKSLVEFAAGLAPRMDEAVKSPEKAETFYNELKDCVENQRLSAAKTIRALCLANIKVLGQKVPALHERAETTFENADPEIVRLAR